MGERESQLDREMDLDTDLSEESLDADLGGSSGVDLGRSSRVDLGGTDQPAGQQTDQTTDESGGLRDRIRGRVGSIVSTTGLLTGTVLSLVGIYLVGNLPLAGAVPFVGLLGIPLGTLVHGAFGEDSRYIEAALAGALAGGGAVLLSNLLFVVLGLGLGMAGVAAGVGALAGALGHYFGRDLRDGLTRDIE